MLDFSESTFSSPSSRHCDELLSHSVEFNGGGYSSQSRARRGMRTARRHSFLLCRIFHWKSSSSAVWSFWASPVFVWVYYTSTRKEIRLWRNLFRFPDWHWTTGSNPRRSRTFWLSLNTVSNPAHRTIRMANDRMFESHSIHFFVVLTNPNILW